MAFLLPGHAEKYGTYADSPESAADIPKFLATFKGQVDMKVSRGPASLPLQPGASKEKLSAAQLLR